MMNDLGAMRAILGWGSTGLLKWVLPVLGAAFGLQAVAGPVSVAEARRVAADFVGQRAADGAQRLRGATVLTLAHAEASQAVAGANDYYVFNASMGGWVVVSGDDRATAVLAYGDEGRIDFDRLPCAAKALLDGYKLEMEWLQRQAGPDVQPAAAPAAGSATVGPLIATRWGQDEPYNLMCPDYQNERCRVGCVATAMAQVMNYWRYPEQCGAIPSYFCYTIFKTIGTLQATTFDYSLLLDSYCHWDWDASELVQDAYTEAQAQEVAKLSRYCGQAVQMGYGGEGSRAMTSNQLAAMRGFGYRSTARLEHRNGLLGGGYSDAQWESMLRAELDAGRPVFYTAYDISAGGHTFICDGYRADGKFHFNMGWYGTCDGWYATTALNMNHYEGLALGLNLRQEVIVGVEPPEGWVRPAGGQPGDVDGNGMLDIDDLNIVVNIMLGADSADRYDGRGNADGQGGIDVNDINMIINLMLGRQ